MSYEMENEPPAKRLAVQNWVSQEIQDLEAYHVPPATECIKLDAMESPFDLPADLKSSWLKEIEHVALNRYPDPSCRELKQILREKFDLPDGSGLVLGNGSDELIQMLVMLVAGEGVKILAPTPTFSMYEIIAAATGCEFIGVPLNLDFSINVTRMLAEIKIHHPACVFLAYPNNPTGNCFDEESMRTIIEHAPGLVVIDEAYFAFCQRSFVEKLEEYPNLIILRTMSKSGLAGIRLGLLIGHVAWTEQLEKLRLPYNISSLTQATAKFYLSNQKIFDKQSLEILEQRTWLAEQLRECDGLDIFQSEANFILIRVPHDSEAIFEAIRKDGILVRSIGKPGGPLSNCLRVTVSTEAENKKFLSVFKKHYLA